MTGAAVAAVGVLTGWGNGIRALPPDARRAAAGRRVIPLGTPVFSGERFRRATRECVLGVAAVDAVLRDAGLARDAIRGRTTALIYVTAAAYIASNRAFVDSAATGSALHFPYTAPSAVPAEVAIEFGLSGRYVILIGGPAATVDALWQACMLVASGAAERALVLAVETFAECTDLWARGRWLVTWPLTEAAACALVVPARTTPRYRAAGSGEDLAARARHRAGETLACEPLIELALTLADGGAPTARGQWCGRRASLAWGPDEPRPGSSAGHASV